jgi:protein MpaA
MRILLAMCAALACSAVCTAAAGARTYGPVPSAAAGAPLPGTRTVLVGRSVAGRRIVARRVGERGAPRKALVVGAIHGDEPEGLRVTRAIRRLGRGTGGLDLWVIDSVNPDGLAARSRRNRHGVDLNRNFATGWRRNGRPGTRYYGGPRPFSEPESRAVRELTRQLRPAVTIWYHQPYGYAIAPEGGDHSIVRDYGRLARYPLGNPPGPVPPGQAPTWQNAAVPGSTAFIVELPARGLPGRAIRRHARAAIRVARLGRRAARDLPRAAVAP